MVEATITSPSYLAHLHELLFRQESSNRVFSPECLDKPGWIVLSRQFTDNGVHRHNGEYEETKMH